MVGLLSRSFWIFRIVPESRVSVGQKNPRWELIKWPLAGKTQEESSTGLEAGARENKFARSTRPPTQMQPQAPTARTQQVRSATRMSSCFRSDPECRDVDASAPCQRRLTDSNANDVVQLRGVCHAAVRTTAIRWFLYTVGRAHFPSTKVSVQSWYAARRTSYSVEVEQQTRSHRTVSSQGRLLQPSHWAQKPQKCTSHLFRASRRRLCSVETEASWRP